MSRSQVWNFFPYQQTKKIFFPDSTETLDYVLVVFLFIVQKSQSGFR